MPAPKRSKADQPPRDGVVFAKMWNNLLQELKKRSNFNPMYHLPLLEILCSLYQDEHNLTNIIELVGMTYETSGRNGDFVKTRPEVAQLNRTRGQIKQYSMTLGLNISAKNSHPTSGNENAGSDDWA